MGHFQSILPSPHDLMVIGLAIIAEIINSPAFAIGGADQKASTRTTRTSFLI
jgi:hypothetical protein